MKRPPPLYTPNVTFVATVPAVRAPPSQRDVDCRQAGHQHRIEARTDPDGHGKTHEEPAASVGLVVVGSD